MASEVVLLVETLRCAISASWTLGGETVGSGAGAWEVLCGGEMVVDEVRRAAEMITWICGL